MSEESLSIWLVRKIRRQDGRLLARPALWGKVPATSESAAVRRFIQITKSNTNPTHFDAVPFTSGGTR